MSEPTKSHGCKKIVSAAEFASEIVKSIREGFAFVPFVGAGFSVASGIPATPAMYRYLEYCMLAAFGLVPERRRNPWAPRHEPWPTLASWSSDDLPTSGRIHDIWRDELVRHPMHPHLREAYGALADWRSALRFFSRIDEVVPSVEGDSPARVHLGASDPSIIDSFFRALMENRRPALTHKMLFGLSTVLRCDVLLTTNFDDLIERAFLDAGAPLSVYEVPSHDPLPAAGLVLRERTLVKLHGGKFWLRADDTLDEPPSREDARNFLGYLAGRPLAANPQAVGDDLKVVHETTALLVCGLSANDRRIQHLLAHALAWMPKLRIYWLGFVEGDFAAAGEVAKVAVDFAGKRTELSSSVAPVSGAAPKSPWDRVFVHLHPNPGLFCLQLFQELANALPPSGAIFPALWKLATPPQFFAPRDAVGPRLSDSAELTTASTKQGVEFGAVEHRLKSHIRRKLRAYATGSLNATLAPVLIEVRENCSGGLCLAQRLHREQGWGHADKSDCSRGFPDPVRALWFDLDDIVEPAGFFLRLVLMIANACGEYDPISRLNIRDFYGSQREFDDFCEAIALNITRLTRESGALWLVTVNAKESPGCNSLFRHESIRLRTAASEAASTAEAKCDNRWQDVAYAARFADAINELVNTRRLPIQFVFVAYSQHLKDPRDRSRVVPSDECPASHVCLWHLWTQFGQFEQQEWVIEEDFIGLPTREDIVTNALGLITASEPDKWREMMRFAIAYATALIRIARYPVAISEVLQRLRPHLRDYGVALPTEAEFQRFLTKEVALYCGDPRDGSKPNDERGFGLLREKQGGFLWMHLEERRLLLQRLHTRLCNMPKGGLKKALMGLTLRLHWYVARWYGRLLLSSLDPLAAFQAVDHIFRGLEFAAECEAELFQESSSSVRRLPVVMIRHARHVLGVAEPLFSRHLSDQFANLALEGLLQTGLVEVRKRFDGRVRVKPGDNDPFAGVLSELTRVELQILRMYTTLQRKSGRFDEFLGMSMADFKHDWFAEFKTRLRPMLGKFNPTSKVDADSDLTARNVSELRPICLDIANCQVCSRRYDAAHKSLIELLDQIVHGNPRSTRRKTDEQWWQRAVWTWSVTAPKSSTRSLEVELGEAVQVLERLMYLEMHRSQSTYLAYDAARHLNSRGKNRFSDEGLRVKLRPIVRGILGRHKGGPPPKELRRRLLDKAKTWGQTGLGLLRHLAIGDGQRVYIDNVRLRTHEALCEALLAAHTDSADATSAGLIKAKRLLAEAQAYLDEFPLKHGGKLRAVFELRCAEIEILEASVTLRAQATVSQPPVSAGEVTDARNRRDSYRECLAHVYDSLRAVKRAEVVLEEYRKSRWWWWILLVLKVKACEYLYDVRLRRLQEPANRLRAQAGDGAHLADLARQLPPFALHFLRDELQAKVADAQVTDPMFLARIVHSFRKICELDLSFEQEFQQQWKASTKQADDKSMTCPGGRTDLPRVRLMNARRTLRYLTQRLASILQGLDLKQRTEMDADTLDYAELVVLQAEWQVERASMWKAETSGARR